MTIFVFVLENYRLKIDQFSNFFNFGSFIITYELYFFDNE